MTPTRGEIVQACERLDAESCETHLAATDEATRRALGLGTLRRDGALGLWASGVDVLSFNRVIGLGLETPAGPDAIDAFTGAFEAADVRRFMVQLCPDARPNALKEWLEARGFYHHNNWVKLWRDVSPIDPGPSDLRVERIGREHAGEFARILGVGFGYPETLAPWSRAKAGAAGWRHYLAFDGDTPVATGALLPRGDTAWLGMAATLGSHRGRGAQSALIARRVADAASLGCRFVVTETAEETPARPAPSYRNLTRLDFQVAYLRPNFVKVLRAS